MQTPMQTDIPAYRHAHGRHTMHPSSCLLHISIPPDTVCALLSLAWISLWYAHAHTPWTWQNTQAFASMPLGRRSTPTAYLREPHDQVLAPNLAQIFHYLNVSTSSSSMQARTMTLHITCFSSWNHTKYHIHASRTFHIHP